MSNANANLCPVCSKGGQDIEIFQEITTVERYQPVSLRVNMNGHLQVTEYGNWDTGEDSTLIGIMCRECGTRWDSYEQLRKHMEEPYHLTLLRRALSTGQLVNTYLEAQIKSYLVTVDAGYDEKTS